MQIVDRKVPRFDLQNLTSDELLTIKDALRAYSRVDADPPKGDSQRRTIAFELYKQVISKVVG